MKWINAEQQVTVTIYDEEYEERLVKTMTVEEMLDAYTNEGCPTIYSNPERKNGRWIAHEGGKFVGFPYMHYECDHCRAFEPTETNFCPNCGTYMRG